jgi:hypothetical protein
MTQRKDGIWVEKSQSNLNHWWILGNTYPERSILKTNGCRWSAYKKAWYYEGETLPDSLQALVTVPTISPPQPEETPGPTIPPAPIQTVSTEPIRIIKPENSAEEQQVIQTTKFVYTHTLPVISSKTSPIGQKFVGELTGSISGNVFCYGYATHKDILLYLNLGGPRMAVEAIRARLAKGEIVNLVPYDAPALELSAGETHGKPNTGMFTAYINSIAEAKFTSAILVHECITQPNYLGKSVTAIFRTSEQQATVKLLHHIRELVSIPVFDQWAGYLYQVGQNAGLAYTPQCGGDIDLLVIDLDASAWTRLITGGLANHVLEFPNSAVQ